MIYRHTQDMGEISGFIEGGVEGGQQYENCCQDMLEAGCKWIEGKPPLEDGITYEELEEVMIQAAEPFGATFIMLSATIARVKWVSQKGWNNYCNELRMLVSNRKEKQNVG